MQSASVGTTGSSATIGRCLLDLDHTSAEVIRAILQRSQQHLLSGPDARHDTLDGVTVANLFFEDSTRTRVSFSIAARRLGADVVDLTGKGSSVSKGESVADTARTVEAMGVKSIVVRHHASGAAQQVADAVKCAVLNAGDGRHAHPTQGLLDALTVANALDRAESFDFSGLRIAIVGDIAHSRVARSDIGAFVKLGASVVCVGPPQLAPRSLAAMGCDVSHSLDDVIESCDAIQMLRVQFERGASIGSSRSYVDAFQLNEQRASRMKRHSIVMHPGPMNRGVEITSRVADGDQNKIFAQVTAGVAVRMAALEMTVSWRGAE